MDLEREECPGADSRPSRLDGGAAPAKRTAAMSDDVRVRWLQRMLAEDSGYSYDVRRLAWTLAELANEDGDFLLVDDFDEPDDYDDCVAGL